MVVLVAAETNEREGLLAFLEAHRGAVRRSVHGLTEEQARATPTASSLSLGGLLKHVATCEQHWTEGTLMGRELTQQPWADQHRLLDGETVADWLKQYEEIAAETDRIIRALPDLETDAALADAPWFPPNSRRTARWILTHLCTEVARHAGHADIIRETLDGRTALELVAEVNGGRE
ncbi:putative damage-inducible protein DinB [Kitasatospora gansuensis]|uniref:Putative damage-inducible protein DinB n=1 Tax=Kitasatospora gansuensis TaxID=258050 RepID=A0A7W7WIY6_9ACTN|nr:DinB family protein [Kitasatospora gansuensis]MBB4948375.1 putative damage-inducible protein DinB [Kitasatospora gansuensis]